ncbi:hypothetical protein [Streptomyces sp. NPDC057623]|uniref:hypothetical protein n=1 Tax=Streptomyces sp. NPDC057623 TaxID=3346187 RepID=UPI00369833A9
MDGKYPLVEQREYGAPRQRGGWLRTRPRRAEEDLPLVAPHQVRVFRVGEEYVEDHGRLGPDAPVVVAASSVTVVDRRVGVPVGVELSLPSAEGGDFTVRVTFHCTVTDAVAAVRDGVTVAEPLLAGYLRAIPGLVEDVGELSLPASAEVRRRIDARLTAYAEMRPPVFSGLTVVPSGIEVLTPAELAEHLRGVEEARLARERDRQLAELRREQALLEERHRQELGTLRSMYEREVSEHELQHELTLEERRNRFVRHQVDEDTALLRGDPAAAYLNAFRSGKLSADVLAERLHAVDSQRADREDARHQLEREHLERRVSFDREDERFHLEREDKRTELARLDDLRERQERREEARRLREEEREWRERRLRAQQELGVMLIDRGLVDDVSPDVRRLFDAVAENRLPSAILTAALASGGDEEAQQGELPRSASGAGAEAGRHEEGCGDDDLGEAVMEERLGD